MGNLVRPFEDTRKHRSAGALVSLNAVYGDRYAIKCICGWESPSYYDKGDAYLDFRLHFRAVTGQRS